MDLAPSIDWKAAKELSEGVAANGRLAFAQNFTGAVVRCFWRELVACGKARDNLELLAPLDLSTLPQKALAAAETLGRIVAREPIDEASHLLGMIYMSVLPDEVRTSHGIYYTPPQLVERLLQSAEEAGVDWATARVVDPACGCGAFLIPLLQRMMNGLEGVAPSLLLQNLSARLKGFDIDPFGAWLAQVVLSAALQRYALAAGRPVPCFVETRDSLEIRPRELGAFDLVVGNPPYGRVTLSPAQRKVYARSVYGHANMYGLFTDAALRWLKPHGVAAYVTPTSMLSGLYYKSLRSLLAKKAAPVSIEFVSERTGVFADVQQETMLATYKVDSTKRTGRVGFIELGDNAEAKTRNGGEFRLPRDCAAPWLLPRKVGQSSLARRLRDMPTRLSDYGYSVSTGPLVWNRFKQQLHDGPGKNRFPVIWAESVSAGGSFSWRSEKRNHAPWFEANHPKDDWLIVDRPCVLLQRTTAKEQARRLIAGELPVSFIRRHGGVVVENHLNMIRAKDARPVISAKLIAILLNSAAVDAAFRCINGSVAVSAFELEETPLPTLANLDELEMLILQKAGDAKIEAAIAAMYGEDDAPAVD